MVLVRVDRAGRCGDSERWVGVVSSVIFFSWLCLMMTVIFLGS